MVSALLGWMSCSMPSLVDSTLLMTTGLSSGLLPLPANAVAGTVAVLTTSKRSWYCAESTPSGSAGGVTLTRIGVLVLVFAANPSGAMLPLSMTGSNGFGLYH